MIGVRLPAAALGSPKVALVTRRNHSDKRVTALVGLVRRLGTLPAKQRTRVRPPPRPLQRLPRRRPTLALVSSAMSRTPLLLDPRGGSTGWPSKPTSEVQLLGGPLDAPISLTARWSDPQSEGAGSSPAGSTNCPRRDGFTHRATNSVVGVQLPPGAPSLLVLMASGTSLRSWLLRFHS